MTRAVAHTHIRSRSRSRCRPSPTLTLPVKNHGIPEGALTGALDAARRFFAQPLAAKALLDIHRSANFKGYTALLGENTNSENRGDLHEGFDVGWEEPGGGGGGARAGDGAMAGGNVWPDAGGLPGFREAVLEY